MTTAVGHASTTAEASPESQTGAATGKLQKAAREFEAILLQSWLEKMNQGLGTPEGQDPAHDTVTSLGMQAIAGALAQRGGIGIAAMILRQLQPSSAQMQPPEPAKVGANEHQPLRR